MTVVDLPVGYSPGRVAEQWSRARVSRRSRWARLARDEISVLTVVALIGYLASAWWTRFGLHFWINDALNRSDDALYVSIGRDPHLGAIGFYWPPLPQLLQVPIMPFLRPFGEEIMAGPISTALCLAVTIPVLASIGRRLQRSRLTVFLVCAVFAFSPYIVYTASNGMSEACSYLTVAVTMLGFIGYIQTQSTKDLLILTLGLSAVVMTRPEGPAFVIAIVVVAAADLRRSRIRNRAWQLALIAIPPLAVYLFWLTVQWVLLKDFLFFLHQNQAQTALTAGAAVWLPAGIFGNPMIALHWALGWVLVFCPILLALGLTALPALRRPLRGTLGILAGMGAFVAVQLVSVSFQNGYGDPRYFCMGVLFGAITALWLAGPADAERTAAGRRSRWASWNLGLVAVLLFSGAYTSYTMTSGRLTHVEDECVYFQYGVAELFPALGRPQTGRYACRAPGDGLKAWQQADTWLDAHLSSHQRVLSDNGSDYAADLFSTRPKLFVVRNDRDWSKIVANPVGISYILTQSTTERGVPTTGASDTPDVGAQLVGYDPVGWHLVESYSGGLNVDHQVTWVQIWHYVPHPGSPTPQGSQTALDQGR